MSRPALLASGLTCRVGRGAASVLANDGVDLRVDPGEVLGLLGPNGAGKTTAVRQIVGLRRPERGSVRLLGHDILRDPGTVGRLAAYLAQTEPALLDLTPALAIDTTGRLRGLSPAAAKAATGQLLDELGLDRVATRPVLRLSGGERRLTAVAAALVADRPVLVLDEPTTGLDAEARRRVWSALQRRRAEQGAAVLLVTHNVVEAETVVDRVAVMEAGRVIACDTPGRLKASVSDEVRLDLVWRADPPMADATVRSLASTAVVTGRRWSLRLPAEQARRVLGEVTAGPAFAALDDFTLATPSLEDVYLSLGGLARDLERV